MTAVAMRSRRNRTVYAAVVLFLVALSFASVNGWWYVSNFGVPWSNAFPAWHYAFATALLGLTVVVLLAAAWFHFVAPTRPALKARPKPGWAHAWPESSSRRWPLRRGCWWCSRWHR